MHLGSDPATVTRGRCKGERMGGVRVLYGGIWMVYGMAGYIPSRTWLCAI